MKKTILICLCAVVFVNCVSQKGIQTNQKEYPLVTVKDWGKSSMSFANGWWDNKKDEIVKQIGEEEFAKMLLNSGWQNIPEQMSFYNGREKSNAEIVYQKLAKLKAYKIATFKNIFQDKYWGDYNILRVPYSENSTWDTTAKWDTVYFIVEAEAVEEVKK